MYYGGIVMIVNEESNGVDGLDPYIERKIVVGLLFNTDFLGRIKQMCGGYGSSLFAAKSHQKIVKWCFDFHDSFGKAPNTKIDLRLLFEAGSRKVSDPDMRERLEGIMESLTEQYESVPDEWEEPQSVGLLLDHAVKYLEARTYIVHEETIHEYNKMVDIEERLKLCKKIMDDFKHVQSAKYDLVDGTTDKELRKSSLEKQSKPIFTLPGALGKVVNGQLVEGGFVALMGPEKRGKSYLLMEIALQACRQGIQTAIIQAGDMDDEDMLARIQVRMAKKSHRERYCGEIAVPVLDCVRNQEDACNHRERTSICGLAGSIRKKSKKGDDEDIQYKMPKEMIKENPEYVPCTECRKDKNSNFQGAVWWTIRPPVEPLTTEEFERDFKRYMKIWHHFPKQYTQPAGTVTVSALRRLLEDWEVYKKFIPKVLVIDYMDLLAPEKFGAKDFRHAQNEIWKDMRGLAQSRHCLIVSATQTDAASYNTKTLSMANFSEDKRKYGHVTAMWGLNQTNEEKMMGIMRINQLVARSDAFNSHETVTILQNIQTGQPLINSFMSR
jgi:hypothetical protein